MIQSYQTSVNNDPLSVSEKDFSLIQDDNR